MTPVLHTFDAFLSYARAASATEAEALKRGIEQFARPWNRARSSTVFLDDQSLSASSSLEDSITGALAQASWLIVLLSEAAAASPWVNREISWWLDHRDPDRMLLVHNRGVVRWEDGDFTTDSTAIPPALRGRLKREPRWIDLLWFDTDDSLGEQDPRFTDVVLQLYCPIHQLDRESALAQRDRRVRRAKRLMSAAIATLSGLLVVAVAAGGFALIKQRDAETAALQASAQAHAAQAVLELPYSGSAAIEAAIQASTESDDASVRASMLTVADQTSRLRRIFQYPLSDVAGDVRGLSFSRDGEFLHAWGDTDAGRSRLVTWSTSTGKQVADATIAERRLSFLLDAGPNGYIACIPFGPVQIDRETLAITKLTSPVSGGVDDEYSNTQCSTRYFDGGVLAQGYGDDQHPNVYAFLDDGRRVDIPNGSSGSGPSGQRAVAVTLFGLAYYGDVLPLDMKERGYFFLTAKGVAEVPYKVPQSPEAGIVNQSPSGQVVIRGANADFYSYDAVSGSEVLRIPTPPGTVHVAPLPESTGFAWITSGGRVGWTGGGQQTQLTDVHPPDGDLRDIEVYRPQIVPYRDGLLASMGRTVWRLTLPIAGGGWVVEPLAGSLPAPNGPSLAWEQPAEAGVCARGTSLLAIDRQYVDGDRIATATGPALLAECRAVDLGPPLAVDGQVVSGATPGDSLWGEDRHFAVAPTGSLALAQVGGRIELLSEASRTVWSRTALTATVMSDGGQLARFEDGAVFLAGAEREERLELPAGAEGVAVRPDARAVVVYVPDLDQLQLVEVGRQPVPLASQCLAALRSSRVDRIEFRPGRGYLNKASDLSAMRPVVQSILQGDIDCLTGEPESSREWINQRRYGVTDGGEFRLVWTPPDIETGMKVSLTQLAPGGEPRTRELPGEIGPVRFGVTGTPSYGFDTSGDMVVKTLPERVIGELHRWESDHWVLVNRFAGTQGAAEFGVLTPDASLVILVTADGGFDVFDASTARRLTGGQGFLSGTVVADVTTIWRDGVLWLHVGDSEDNLTRIEIPLSAANLRSLLCARAAVPGC